MDKIRLIVLCRRKEIKHQGGERSLGMELKDKERNSKNKKKAGERGGKDWGKREKPTSM